MIKTISKTQDTVLVVDDGIVKTARADHPKWADILKTFDRCGHDGSSFTGPTDELLALMDLKTAVENYTVGRLSVCPTGVTYTGRPIHTIDADRVLAFMKEGLSYKPIANYIERKMKNPSSRAIQEMYNFLEHKGMPLTVRGTFLAYKGVTMDFWSINGNKETVVLIGETDSGGRIRNEIGKVIEVERSSVDDDFRVGCSHGLHAGSLSYAKGWGQRVVIVEIDPADVVSVPEDCNCQKLRCCKYTVIGEYNGPLPDTLCTDYDNKDEPDVCHTCGATGDCDCDVEADEVCEHCGDDTCDGSCQHEEEVPNETPAERNQRLNEAWLYEQCKKEENAVPLPHTGPVPEAEPIPNAPVAPVPVVPLDHPGVFVRETDVCGCGLEATHDGKICGDCFHEEERAQERVEAANNEQYSSIYKKLVALFCEQLGIEESEIEPETVLNAGIFGMDSLDGVELCMAVEEEFGFEIPDLDAENSIGKTFSDIVKYIQTRLGQSNKYNEGQYAGQGDRANGAPAQWHSGDEQGADSPAHAEFIRGYVHGYGIV
jgi:acyl carrier protein